MHLFRYNGISLIGFLILLLGGKGFAQNIPCDSITISAFRGPRVLNMACDSFYVLNAKTYAQVMGVYTQYGQLIQKQNRLFNGIDTLRKLDSVNQAAYAQLKALNSMLLDSTSSFNQRIAMMSGKLAQNNHAAIQNNQEIQSIVKEVISGLKREEKKQFWASFSGNAATVLLGVIALVLVIK